MVILYIIDKMGQPTNYKLLCGSDKLKACETLDDVLLILGSSYELVDVKVIETVKKIQANDFGEQVLDINEVVYVQTYKPSSK